MLKSSKASIQNVYATERRMPNQYEEFYPENKHMKPQSNEKVENLSGWVSIIPYAVYLNYWYCVWLYSDQNYLNCFTIYAISQSW